MTDQNAKIEAAVLRRLIDHLQKRSDVQNIDLMNLGGFCRNLPSALVWRRRRRSWCASG